MSQAWFDEEVDPLLEVIGRLLSEAGVPFLFTVIIDQETDPAILARSNFPPEGMKTVTYVVRRNSPIVRVNYVPDDTEMMGTIIESGESEISSFNGRAIDFSKRDETPE